MTRESIKSLYRKFDKSKRGYIKKSDIKREFQKINKVLSASDLDYIFETYCPKSHKRMTIVEFYEILLPK